MRGSEPLVRDGQVVYESVSPPDEWVVSMVCEAFGCLPSAAVREIDEGHGDLLWRILDFRAFARTKAEMDRAKHDPRATIEIGPETAMVEEIAALADAEAWAEVKAERRRQKGD